MSSLALNLKEQLKAGRDEVIATFQNDHKPEKLLTSLRVSVDAALTQAWQALAFPENMTLIAVGGYGRGDLFPYYDVDVLILLDAAPDDALRAKLEEIVQLFWDLGLEIGHSIRTIDECLSESAADITVQTSLLEARLITGNRTLFKKLQERFDEAMDARAFFQAKTLELQQRHAKYEDTPYSLEPSCKERAFKDIRIRLHIHTKRREDRLIFDVQTPLAESFGFHTTSARRASEYLMQRYYWAAKTVTQLNTILLQNIQAQLFPQALRSQPINERFNEVNGMIDIAQDDTFETSPSAMLEVFLLLEHNPKLKGMTARTMRALWHARFHLDAKFRRDPAYRALFLQILQAPQGVTHALRCMNEMSILGRYLPNFRRIVGQMQHDLFHVFTVDQHILMVMRNVRRFTLAEHAH